MWDGGASDAGLVGDFGEAHGAVVTVERSILVAEVGDGDAHASGVEVVAERYTHVGLLDSIFGDSYAGFVAELFEVAVAFVVVEVVGLAVVGYEEVKLAVVVEIGPNCGEAEETLRVVDACLFRDFGEGTVAIVVEEGVGIALESSRAALDGDLVVLAGFARAEERQVVHVEVDVVWDEEIDEAVAVIVAEGEASGPACVFVEAGGFGDVGEGSICRHCCDRGRRHRNS